MLSLKTQTLITFALAALGTGSAQAQFGGSCCSIYSNPNGVVPAQAGDTVLYDLELDSGKCEQGIVSWTLEPLDLGLQVTAIPNTDQRASVAVGAAAPEVARWRARARNTDPITGRPICTGTRVFQLDVTSNDPLPDFDVESVSPATGANLVGGIPFNVTSVIRNIGSGPAGATSARLFLDGVPSPSLGCPALEPGETCPNLIWSVTLEAGAHEIKVCADTFNEQGESNETNNCGISTVDVAEPLLADLKINYIEVDPTVLAETGQGHVNIQFTNQGDVFAPPFDLVVEGPGTFDPPSKRLWIGPGGTANTTFVWTAGSPVENGTITATMDANQVVPEYDELNNTASAQVTVLPLLPDLVFTVDDVSISPAAPEIGDTLEVRVRMRNAGTVIASGIATLDIEAFGQTRQANCAFIPVGDYCEIYEYFYVQTSGPQQVVVRADVNNSIHEIDETNNYRSLNFNVAGPEVTCQGTWILTQTFPPPEQGEDPPVVTSAGSVVENSQGTPCYVYFGQNTATTCWRTIGSGGLQALWLNNGLCPVSVTVTDPGAAPGEPDLWTYSVHIQN